MATKGSSPSVIAKLMGLEEMPSQLPIGRQQRVLSESYLQKSASVVSLERRSKLKNDKDQSRLVSKRKVNSMVNDLNEDVSLRYRDQISYPFEDILDMNSTIGFNSENKRENGKSEKSFAKRNNLRSLQKLANGNAADSFDDRGSDYLKDSGPYSPTAIVILRPDLGNGKYASVPSFLLDSQTTFAWEAKKQLLERLKRTRVSQKVQAVSRGCTLHEMLSMPDLEMRPRPEVASPLDISSDKVWKNGSVIKFPVFKCFSLSSNPTTKLKKMSKSDVELSSGRRQNNFSANSTNSPMVSNSSSSSFASSDSNDRSNDTDFPYGDAETKRQSEPMNSNFAVTEGCYSYFSDASFGKESPIRPLKDGFISSNCIEIDEDYPKSMDEAYQPSPNSVLDKEDHSSSSEYSESIITDLQGLWTQLQLLKSESEENHSGVEMVVSTDEDATEKSSSCTGQNLKSVRCFGAKESRDFSYLVDLLEASGFYGGNVEISFSRWHSPECMASPSDFETLEKKYGEQASWTKAERKLLFDRINSGVLQILRPCIDISLSSKPSRRKMSTLFKRDIIEEELWKLLLSQENEVNKELSDKAVGREPWLDLVDEIDSIVREIEFSLVEELAAELVSI